MQKPKRESLVLGRLLKRIAPRIGARVLLEPEWEIAGRITFRSGRHSYFRYNTLDLNPVGSADLSKDKDYANFFMGSLGYKVVPGSKTFFSDAWGKAVGARRRFVVDAYRYALKLGMPVVVKPNSGSQGKGVALVYTKREFYAAMRAIFKLDRIALVQKPVTGRDYRLVVLDDEIISAYERLPLSVTGDGRSTIKSLLMAKQRAFLKEQRDTQIKVDDPRIARKLARFGYTLSTRLPKNAELRLLDNANLSTGGDAVDVTDQVHPEFKQIAVSLTRDMGLRLCGVDLMVDGDIRDAPGTYWILETNAAPGLDHYVRMGKKQERVVESLYLKVLEHLDRQSVAPSSGRIAIQVRYVPARSGSRRVGPTTRA